MYPELALAGTGRDLTCGIINLEDTPWYVTGLDALGFGLSAFGVYSKYRPTKPISEPVHEGENGKPAGEAQQKPNGSAAEGAEKYSESQIKNILDELKGDGFKNNPLRQAYEKEVADLSKMKDSLLKQGMSQEDMARTLNQARRDLGIKYKDATPQPLRDYIYEFNQNRYGDPLGPTFEKLRANGKTFEQIIDSASRPNADINNLLSGFEQWLRGK